MVVKKKLSITEGEVFEIDGRTAFLILPKTANLTAPTPWVWYAPTLRKHPGQAESWMFERFLADGIAIAGIDVGESYGSPDGRAHYSALYKELVENRNLSKRASMLARSRGGLMLYNWATEHPGLIACVAGIYPVCNLSSYPGLKKACKAYGMTERELKEKLTEHNPIDRLAPLAKANVPLFHIHGDKDGTVPLNANSQELKNRYETLGGTMTLKIFEGRGHDLWSGWFQNQALVDFIITNARNGLPESKE